MVADGTPVPGHEGRLVAAGTVLYKVLCCGLVSHLKLEVATWEEEEMISRVAK